MTPQEQAQQNLRLLQNLKQKHYDDLNIKDFAKAVGLDNAIVCRLYKMKESWTTKTCDILNAHFNTDIFKPVRYSDKYKDYSLYSDNIKRNPRRLNNLVNKFNVGDKVKWLRDGSEQTVQKVEYYKYSKEWLYTLDKYKTVPEKELELIEKYIPEVPEGSFDIGTNVLYNTNEGILKKGKIIEKQYNQTLKKFFYKIHNHLYWIPEGVIQRLEESEMIEQHQKNVKQYEEDTRDYISIKGKKYYLEDEVYIIDDGKIIKTELLGYEKDHFITQYDSFMKQVFNNKEELKEYLIQMVDEVE